MLNILVCVKQVPDVDLVKMTPKPETSCARECLFTQTP